MFSICSLWLIYVAALKGVYTPDRKLNIMTQFMPYDLKFSNLDFTFFQWDLPVFESAATVPVQSAMEKELRRACGHLLRELVDKYHSFSKILRMQKYRQCEIDFTK